MTQLHSRDLAFERVYEAWRSQVFRWSLTFGCGARGFAEDLTHDVFLKVLEELPRLPPERELGFWLYRVTANLAISRIRRDRSFLGRVGKLFLVSEEVDEGAAPDVRFELKEAARAAVETLESLPPKERVVMTLKLIEGKSQQEICSTLSLSKGYVSKLVARGWERIRAAGWEVSDAA